MSEWASEHEFPLPDGGSWLVRAYEFPTGGSAYDEWVRLKATLVGDNAQGNHSAWRTMTPDGTTHLVVVCGRPDDLPEVRGEPYDLDYDNACAFALRRARLGVDALDENPEQEALSQEAHYDQPMHIDVTTGYVKRWYRP